MNYSDETRVLFFQGPPSSGKDTICDYLARAHPDRIVKISAKRALIQQTVNYFNVDMDWFMGGYDEVTKNVPCEELLGRSRRQALIYVSEDVLKPKYGKGVFGQCLLEDVQGGKINVVSDSGFTEECKVVSDGVGVENCMLFRLSRSGASFIKSGDSRRYIPVNRGLIPVYYGSAGKEEPVSNPEEYHKDGDVLDVSKVGIIYNNRSLSDLYHYADILIKEWL